MSSPSSSIKAKAKQRWRDKWLPSSSKAKDVGGEVSGALITTLTIVKESLDGVPVPGLKAAVGGVLEVITVIKKSQSNAEDLEQLRNHVQDLMNLVIEPVKNAKMTDSLEARINKLTADLEHIKLDHEKMSKKGRVRQFMSVHDHAETIVGLDRMLNRALQIFMAGGIIQVEKRTEEIHEAMTASEKNTKAIQGRVEDVYDATVATEGNTKVIGSRVEEVYEAAMATGKDTKAIQGRIEEVVEAAAAAGESSKAIVKRIEDIYDVTAATGNDTQAVLEVAANTDKIIKEFILSQGN
ncbi:hypothetical protein FRC02_011535 [Tulasnella sp. 418]|nr:hypothetical protein FRC02_011535 [Tulasnella sp. 418]